MKRTIFSVMMVLMLLAGLVVATGAAGDEPAEVGIPVWLELTYDIYPGQVGVPRFGWAACSPGLVRAFIGATNWEMMLYDTETGEKLLHLMPDDIDALWGEITIYEEPPDFAELCLGRGRPAYAGWNYPLLGLEPGSYRLRTLHWLDHTVVDGADNDGDGMIDLFTPENTCWERFNFLNVHGE